jgi:hypothetical protein
MCYSVGVKYRSTTPYRPMKSVLSPTMLMLRCFASKRSVTFLLEGTDNLVPYYPSQSNEVSITVSFPGQACHFQLSVL